MSIQIQRFQHQNGQLVADGSPKTYSLPLSIGASNEQDIVIDWPQVALRHAEISLNEAQSKPLQVTAFSKHGITAISKLGKKRSTSRLALKPGSRFQLGNTEFLLKQNESGLELEVTQDNDLAKPKRLGKTTRIADTGFSTRRWAWWLFAMILVGALLLPLAQRYGPAAEPIADLPIKLPNHSFWNSGDFHPAHQYFADDCSQCHQKPFEPVKNSSCEACHSTVSAHADPIEFAQPALQKAACQSCHKEHNGKAELITDDKTLCTDCHQNISAFTAGKSQLHNIHDWQQSHPEISLNLPRWDEFKLQWITQEVAVDQNPKETNGLIFPHDIHLRPEGFEDAQGNTQVLNCGDCHQPEPDGKRMQNINMEAHCESCHRLDFDPANPDLFVRHGDLGSSLRDIAGQKGLNALLAEENNGSRSLQRPGNKKRQSQMLSLEKLATELIEKRACVVCHEVTRNEAALAQQNLLDGWQIQPLKMNNHWLIQAEFDHRSHSTQSCDSCHQGLQQSEQSSDVHMPNRAVCSNCHGNPGDANKTGSQCIDCHSYHLPQHGSAAPADNAINKPQGHH